LKSKRNLDGIASIGFFNGRCPLCESSDRVMPDDDRHIAQDCLQVMFKRLKALEERVENAIKTSQEAAAQGRRVDAIAKDWPVGWPIVGGGGHRQ
jgi:hypothetical protein